MIPCWADGCNFYGKVVSVAVGGFETSPAVRSVKVGGGVSHCWIMGLYKILGAVQASVQSVRLRVFNVSDIFNLRILH